MPVDWASMALLSAAVLGLVNINDSHLISRRMPSLRAYMLSMGSVVLVFSLILIYLFPLPRDLGTLPLMVAIASGIFRTTAAAIMFYTMKREEVSRVIPVINTYPVFVAIMAVPLLGEKLYYLQWIAIIIVVAGAVMVSVRQSPGSSVTWLGKAFFLLVGSSLFMAMADVAGKYALAYVSSWNMYCITHFCIAGIFLLISLRPHVLKELGSIKKAKAISILIINEILVVIGAVLMFWAMQRGPVSLVSTIISSRPIFLFIYALIISRVSPMFIEHQPGKAMLALRLIAIIMIVSGIAIIYLT